MERGTAPKDFNTYGARRGNDEVELYILEKRLTKNSHNGEQIENFQVMARGTFANIRLVNKLISKVGPQTLFVPTGEILDIFDAAEKYKKLGEQVFFLKTNKIVRKNRNNPFYLLHY